MTILSCQKRHHEEHPVRKIAGVGEVWCDGLPRWPYTRPKPPRDSLAGPEYGEYQKLHATIAVHNLGQDDWLADWWETERAFYDDYVAPTHAEAITYAQALVNERKKNSGTH